MGFEKDQSSCTGRGFSDVDADGFLKNLHDFVTGHANWGIILDRSAAPSAETCTAVDTGTNELTITGHGFKTCEKVIVEDTGGGVPGGTSNGGEYYAIVVDANTIQLADHHRYAYLGTARNLSSDPGANFSVTRLEAYIVVSDDGTAPTDANDLKNMLVFAYKTNEAGYIRVYNVTSFDATNDIIVHTYCGARINTLDSSAFVYDFRANDNGLFLVMSQIVGTWRGAGVDEFTPLTGFLEDPATISGTAQTSLSSSASSVTVQVTDSAEANLFTKGEFYYIYDFRTGYDVDYKKCDGVGVADGLNADEISFEALDTSFNSGAKISPYPITCYTLQANLVSDYQKADCRYSAHPNLFYPILPFVSNAGAAINDMIDMIDGGLAYGSVESGVLRRQAPDDKGLYAAQRPLLYEYIRQNNTSDQTGMNRAYGESKNIYLTDDDGLSEMTTARTIGGKAHIVYSGAYEAFGESSNLDALVINEA